MLVELAADAPNWRAVLERAASWNLPLDARIVTDLAVAVAPVVAALQHHQLVRVGAFSASSHVTENGLWVALRTAVDDTGIDAAVVGGARTHYTELNRNHGRLPAFPAYTFSVTPQMHVHETAQLVESVPMQHLVARDANWIAAGAPLHVGPITLRARVNAVATTPPTPERDDLRNGYGPNLVSGSTDPRRSDAATATWTVASAAATAAAGAASLTFFETWGPRGLEDAPGNAFPVRAAVQALAELAGAPLLTQTAIAIVANLTDTPRQVAVRFGPTTTTIDVPAWGWRISRL